MRPRRFAPAPELSGSDARRYMMRKTPPLRKTLLGALLVSGLGCGLGGCGIQEARVDKGKPVSSFVCRSSDGQLQQATDYYVDGSTSTACLDGTSRGEEEHPEGEAAACLNTAAWSFVFGF